MISISKYFVFEFDIDMIVTVKGVTFHKYLFISLATASIKFLEHMGHCVKISKKLRIEAIKTFLTNNDEKTFVKSNKMLLKSIVKFIFRFSKKSEMNFTNR